jgi:hypothetical protein
MELSQEEMYARAIDRLREKTAQVVELQRENLDLKKQLAHARTVMNSYIPPCDGRYSDPGYPDAVRKGSR